MCYKADKHRHLSLTLSEKLKDVPDFIAEFFDRYKSAATKNSNWGYIRDLLQWLLEKNYIKKENISQITTEDMDKITSNHVIKYLNELKDGITGRKNSLDSLCTKKNVFSAFWGYMFMNKYVTDNIIRHIPSHLYKSEVTQKEVIVPTDEQVEEFICNLNDGNGNEFNIIRNIAIVKLIMGSGIRSEELINLDMKDLYLDEERPYIMVLGKGKIEQYDKVFISQEAKQQSISIKERIRLEEQTYNSLRKLDILQELVENDDITEIMVNGPSHIFYEYEGRLHKYEGAFSSEEKMQDIIQQIVGRHNRVVNQASPIVDTRLPDGSRVNIVL